MLAEGVVEDEPLTLLLLLLLLPPLLSTPLALLLLLLLTLLSGWMLFSWSNSCFLESLRAEEELFEMLLLLLTTRSPAVSLSFADGVGDEEVDAD